MADIDVTLALNNSQFNQNLNRSEQEVQRFSNTATREIQGVQKLFAGMGSALAGIGFGALITEAANLSSEIVNVAKATGLSTAAVKGWGDALQSAGGNADNARDGLVDLNAKMSEARQSGGDLLESFNAVGISLKDLQSLSQEEIMKNVITGLAGVTDASERSRLAMVLMGEDVNRVDWNTAANNIDGFVNSAEAVAPALEDAKRAQDEFNATYNQFLTQLTVAIPWDSLTSGLKTIGDNLQAIKDLAVAVASLYASFMLFNRVTAFTTVLEGFATGALTATAASTALVGIGARLVQWFRDIRTWGLVAIEVWGAGLPIMEALAISVGALITVFGRLGIVAGVLYGVKAAFESLTGVDTWDWAQRQAKALGIIDETSKEEEARKARMKKAADESLKAMEAESTGRERQAKVLTDTTTKMVDMVAAYRDHNNEILKGIQNETAMIGLGEDQKRVQEKLLQLENERDAKIKEINDKIKEGGDPSILEQYRNSIGEVNKAYDEQKVAILGALDAQTKALEADRLRVFTNEQLTQSIQRVNQMNQETATMFLPLLEQKYKDIEFAAKNAAEAQMAAEAASRGITVQQLPTEDVEKIKAAANAKVQAEKDAATALEHAVELKNMEDFQSKQIQDATAKTAEIYQEMARSTMPELQKKQQEILDAATQQAQQAIATENARRGINMNAAEERAYYEAAVKGTRELLKATEESYNQSREWSTGWTQAMNTYISSATNGAQKAQQIFSKAMSGMEDLLVNFVKTGKFEWKGFLTMMLEELLRAQIQAIFASTMGNMTGALKGSTSGFLDGLGDTITKTVTNTVGGIWDVVKNALGTLVSTAFGKGSDALGWLGGLAKSAAGWIGDLAGSIGSWFGDVFSSSKGSSSGGSSWIGTAVSTIGTIASLFFADGGNIAPGKWGIVGEAGPEIVQGPATVTPVRKVPFGEGSGGGANINVTINAVDALSFKQLVARDPAFIYGVAMQGAKSIPNRR